MPADVTNNARVKRWRKNNRAAYNAYMREYMREWRRKRADEKSNHNPDLERRVAVPDQEL